MSSPFAPGPLGPLTMRNRVLKCGTNEGMSRDGLVTEPLIAWHREFAAGGVGMTTLAYCSVSPEGRTFRHQLHMREEALPGLRDFTEAIHAEGALAAIQLGHAGWFASPRATKAAPIGPSRTFSAHAQTFSRAMQPADFDRLERAFADAAAAAVDTGFDGIEIHLGHGYLLSQFLCPWNNRRKDEWGGSLENRARFPRRVLRAVKEAVAGRAAVWPKLNMDDGFEGGLTLDEGVQVAQWLEEDGSVDALQLTGGHTTKTPMYLMRGDVPLRGMIENQKTFVGRMGLRVMAPWMLKPWKFEEAFFLPMARRFREATSLPLMLLGGVNRLDTMEQALTEGFDFLAMGRALIRDPDLVRRMEQGVLKASRCSHCNLCMVEMERGGTRCVEREPVAAPS
ncbi:MAG: NADH:flavin oxidoreductase [Myxococcota bacterium]|nr:NADH:flavin oxidoreductase [Myxococcota bacterium]